ncbi:MAG: hypothetical protein IPM53_03710 [Anaerolineaceae bacterium]|nr:hypothetical protein [Anaerolineaceae bacterium]
MGKGQHNNVLERARYGAEDYLIWHTSPRAAWNDFVGALASVYGKEEGGADTAVWLAGDKDEAEPSRPGIGQSSMAHETIEALRKIGLLHDIIDTKEELVVYPAEMMLGRSLNEGRPPINMTRVQFDQVTFRLATLAPLLVSG